MLRNGHAGFGGRPQETDRHKQSRHCARGRPYIESFNRRLRTECLNPNHWTSLLEARVVIGDFKSEHNLRHRHSALGYRTSAEDAAACTHTHHPVACGIN
ncbi:integrase core domain-containing protein [Nocardia farcinica]|uniref:integrase core domain-containing protein n=1 Tax=Nocardia farcinica TaxID=37329 RepID=UPI0018936900|nr:transposase [Nocardia farcinica]